MVTIRQQVEIETIFFITLAALIGLFFVFKNNQNFQKKFRITAPIIASNNAQTPMTSPIPTTPIVTSSYMFSPDGMKKVIMQTTTNKDNTKTYDFSVVDMQTNVQKTIFSQTVDSSISFSIPFNTFSPDDVYFFITETKPEGQEYLVFKSSGETIENGQNLIDASSILANKITQYSINQITGWASGTLLIVETKKSDGTEGPSYWLEIPSQAVIPLATEF